MLAEKNFAYSDKESFRNTKLVYLNRGIKLFPENFEAYERKGDIYFNDLIMSRNINFSEEAVRMYTKALTLNPYSSRIYRKLAVLYQEIEDFPMSEKMYLKMLDIYPVKKQYNLEATVFYMKQGNKEKAEYYYEKSSHFISATLEEERINDAYIKWIKSQK
jgi:tetratricopeptide (TPR) repeat protein